ncbi:MAG: DsbA family oxidoreductase [Bacteroidota bacterium]|nr:DsbA family oxidoreductase [Bacteroidota bacterium]
MQNKFKIEIWSDILCPFCYIGKRKLEKALENFNGKEFIEIDWRSYQLDPDATSSPNTDVFDYLAKRKGQTRDWSIKMHEQVTNTAKEMGLNYKFEKAIIANSYNAHRLIHLAKKYKLGNEAEEKIFKAYFTDGKDIADKETLITIGKEIGLKEDEIKDVLNSDEYSSEVKADIEEAQKIGVRGVPFFVMNRTHAVSGAQPVEIFVETLEKSFESWKK